VGSEEWVDKKAKKVKMDEFGQQIKQFNQQHVVVDPHPSHPQEANPRELQ